MTLFTIRYDAHKEGNRYAVSTICLTDGAIGGMGFFGSAEHARDVVTSAYRTPIQEVSAEVFRCQRRYFAWQLAQGREQREAVSA